MNAPTISKESTIRREGFDQVSDKMERYFENFNEKLKNLSTKMSRYDKETD